MFKVKIVIYVLLEEGGLLLVDFRFSRDVVEPNPWEKRKVSLLKESLHALLLE
jgi:hypothetical protein